MGKNMSENRQEWVDVAKGFAIIAIVIWHMQYDYYETPYFPLKNLLAGIWPVPVFFMISGFFLTNKKLQHPRQIIKRRILRWYVPTVCLYLVATLLHNWFIKINFYNTEIDYDGYISFYHTADFLKALAADVVLAGRELILSPMWFICVLIVATLIMSLITFSIKRIIINDDKFRIVQLLIFLFLAISYNVLTSMFSIDIPRYSQTFSAMWLIYVGMHINPKNIQFNSLPFCILSVTIVYAFSVLYSNIGNNMFSYTICTSAALYVLCYVSKATTAMCKPVAKLIAIAGKDSFYIMAYHLIAFKVCTLLLSLFGIHNNLALLIAPTSNNLFMYFFYATGGTFIPIAFVYIYRKLLNTVLLHKS